jgi:enterochelin esterase family protein
VALGAGLLATGCGDGSSANREPATPGSPTATAPNPNPPGVPGLPDGGSAGPDGASRAACNRAEQAKTAPTALYDAFVSELAGTPEGARSARVDKLLADVAAQGGTPLEDTSDRVVFLARGMGASGTWSVAGSFTSWEAQQRPMAQVPGTDLFVLDTKIPRGATHPYKLRAGSDWREDVLAKNVVWDGVNRGTVGELNAMVHADVRLGNTGRLVAHRKVHATRLGDDRDVFVYVPARYDDGSCAALPHLVVQDGNESITRGDFVGAADALYAQKPELAAVLVFVALPSQALRMAQYTFNTQGSLGDAYGEFLERDLEPAIGRDYRICAKPSARGLSGASLGGLISTYLAFKQPGAWGFVGAQSSSFFWDGGWMVSRASQDPVVPLRIYLDHGCPNDNCEVNRQMTQALSTKGYDQKHVEAPGAQHDWADWRARLPEMLTYFRDGRSDCN